MEIIVVADKQASKYLSNRENLSTVDGLPVTIGNIVESITGIEPLVWDGKHWVKASPDILIHNQQITNKAEAEALISCLKDGVDNTAGSVGFRGSGSYDTIIVGCDPDVAACCLVDTLEGYFGCENVTLVYTPLWVVGPPDPRLRDKVNKLLYSETVGEAGVADRAKVANVSNVGKIIVVADEKASKFLSNPWNIRPVDKHTILTGNIAYGINGAGRFAWGGKRRAEDYPTVAVHDRQVTKISEIQGVIAGLLIGEYETAIIGCDPEVAPYLTRRLRDVFESENVIVIYPHLGKGFEEYKDLSDRLKELLGRSEDGAGAGADSAGTDGTLSLKITLADAEGTEGAQSTVSIVFDKGTNIELDLSGWTKDTA